jgi:hypothetical protein
VKINLRSMILASKDRVIFAPCLCGTSVWMPFTDILNHVSSEIVVSK